MTPMTDLKLIAFDDADLNVVSAHVQDAILRVGDMAVLSGEKRFAAIVSRFDWLSAQSTSGRQPTLARRRSALRFERVLAARTTGIDLRQKTDVLVLLAVSFVKRGDDDPSGRVRLTFAADAAIELDVECLEAELRDLGPAWTTKVRPEHPLEHGPEGNPSERSGGG